MPDLQGQGQCDQKLKEISGSRSYLFSGDKEEIATIPDRDDQIKNNPDRVYSIDLNSDLSSDLTSKEKTLDHVRVLEQEEALARTGIFPEDLAKYQDFLAKAGQMPGQMLHLDYRLITDTGQIHYVRESLWTCEREGKIRGEAFITDISDLMRANEDLRFLNETIPCGFLKYTCEKQPRVTYVNRRMLEMMHIDPDDRSLRKEVAPYMNDILLTVPMKERKRFSSYLNLVRRLNSPVAGEMTLLAPDGSRIRVYGWVTRIHLADGTEEFQSVCMDITAQYRRKRKQEDIRYLRALSDVYEEIFKYDLSENTVTCLHSGPGSAFTSFENIAMQTTDAADRWLRQTVAEEDQDAVRSFLLRESREKMLLPGELPPQISFHGRSEGKALYKAIFIKFNETSNFLCVRRSPDEETRASLVSQNERLRKNMKGLIQNFTDGVAAFEVMPNNYVRPLYASENVAEFFGVSEERWMKLVEDGIPLEDLAIYSEASLEDFEKLLEDGEGEFTYFDFNRGEDRRIKAICSQRDKDGKKPRYIMLYRMNEPGRGFAGGRGRAGEDAAPLDRQSANDGTLAIDKGQDREVSEVFIRTFGYFDVFVGGKPIAFRNKKSKELLALLVDRRGGFISSDEAVSFLWEDEFVTAVTLSRYRKVALRLKNLLEEYGIADIVESVDGKRRIVPERVSCDLYEYLEGEQEHKSLFTGSYLSNYSWGEATLAGLLAQRSEIGDIFV